MIHRLSRRMSRRLGRYAWSIACFTAALACGTARADPLTVQSRTMAWRAAPSAEAPPYAGGWAKGSIKMPFVVAARAPQVAARINEALFLDLLNLPAPAAPGPRFEVASDSGPEGTAELDFKVSRNDARVLAIAADAEGCGAYCETYRRELSFDARTGRALAIDDLLNARGLDVARQRMLAERQRRYAEQIRTLKQERQALLAKRATAKGAGAKDEFDDLEARISLNEGCLSEARAPSSEASEARFLRLALPAGEGLVLTASRCSNHASRALDDVDEVSATLTRAELAPLLTPYGQALLLDQGDAPAPAAASIFGQVLHGRIGNAAVTWRLERPYAKGAFSGFYYYDKHRKPIPLSGQQAGTTLTITERLSDSEAATITLTRRGERLAGQWQGKGRTLPVDLGP